MVISLFLFRCYLIECSLSEVSKFAKLLQTSLKPQFSITITSNLVCVTIDYE
jgi:hypothetical protein